MPSPEDRIVVPTAASRPWLPVSFALLVIVAVGCARSDPDTKYLQLDFWQFDQTPDLGWRPFAERGEEERAARLIEYYLAGREGLNAGERGYLHFHAAQLWVMQGRDDLALGHLAVARVDSLPDRFPRSWNALVDGTRAFMLGDMPTVRRARDEIAALDSLDARDAMFLQGLDNLATQEGVSYRDVLAAPPD